MAQPPRALLDLQDRLLGVYRYCSNQARKTPAGFVPHLTVGQFKTLVRASTLPSLSSSALRLEPLTQGHQTVNKRKNRWR